MANLFNLTLTDRTDGTDFSIRPSRSYNKFKLYLPGDHSSSSFDGDIADSVPPGNIVEEFNFSVTFGTFTVNGVTGEYTEVDVSLTASDTDNIPPLPIRTKTSQPFVVGTNCYYYDIYEDNGSEVIQLVEGFVEVIGTVTPLSPP